MAQVNGDNEDFDAATEEVDKSNPVIALKNVGGASENIARIFEEFHESSRVQQVRGHSFHQAEDWETVTRPQPCGG